MIADDFIHAEPPPREGSSPPLFSRVCPLLFTLSSPFLCPENRVKGERRKEGWNMEGTKDVRREEGSERANERRSPARFHG